MHQAASSSLDEGRQTRVASKHFGVRRVTSRARSKVLTAWIRFARPTAHCFPLSPRLFVNIGPTESRSVGACHVGGRHTWKNGIHVPAIFCVNQPRGWCWHCFAFNEYTRKLFHQYPVVKCLFCKVKVHVFLLLNWTPSIYHWPEINILSFVSPGIAECDDKDKNTNAFRGNIFVR